MRNLREVDAQSTHAQIRQAEYPESSVWVSMSVSETHPRAATANSGAPGTRVPALAVSGATVL
jgi:hypothetical protein